MGNPLRVRVPPAALDGIELPIYFLNLKARQIISISDGFLGWLMVALAHYLLLYSSSIIIFFFSLLSILGMVTVKIPSFSEAWIRDGSTFSGRIICREKGPQ